MSWNVWSVFQAAGNLASIVGSIGVFYVIATCTTFIISLGYMAVVGITIVVTGQAYVRRLKLRPITRAAMIDTGNRLIRNAKDDVLLLAGDMSWADDYAASIKKLTSEGKPVRIVYPVARATTPKVRENIQTLTDAGATFIGLKTDTHLRAMIIDPAHANDAQLYVVERQLRKEGWEVAEGQPGSERGYQYVGRICRLRDEAILSSVTAALRGAFL